MSSTWSSIDFGSEVEAHEQIKGRPEVREPFGEWLKEKHDLRRGPGPLLGRLRPYPYGYGYPYPLNPTLADVEVRYINRRPFACSVALFQFFRLHPSLSRTIRISADTPLKDVILYLTNNSEITDLTGDLASLLNVSAHPIVQGGLADVYHATRPDGSQLAIKSLRHHDAKHIKHTTRELNTWSKLKHKHILDLLGLALFRERLAMVSPWMEYGHVRAVVNKWPKMDRYVLCQQLADAVEYLHSENVVHGDIKGENVLMGQDGFLKLTDFGLSIMHDQVLHFSETDPGGGTVRWMAPELFAEEAQRSRETDVYAMGMTMLEIITGEIPFSEFRAGWAVIEAVKINRRTPSVAHMFKEPISPRSAIMGGVLHRCWKHDSKARANAEEVATLLGLLGPD